jgi:hypothetical protein
MQVLTLALPFSPASLPGPSVRRAPTGADRLAEATGEKRLRAPGRPMTFAFVTRSPPGARRSRPVL